VLAKAGMKEEQSRSASERAGAEELRQARSEEEAEARSREMAAYAAKRTFQLEPADVSFLRQPK
jgi:hypothetical protein